jgi:hypothetical protein
VAGRPAGPGASAGSGPTWSACWPSSRLREVGRSGSCSRCQPSRHWIIRSCRIVRAHGAHTASKRDPHATCTTLHGPNPADTRNGIGRPHTPTPSAACSATSSDNRPASASLPTPATIAAPSTGPTRASKPARTVSVTSPLLPPDDVRPDDLPVDEVPTIARLTVQGTPLHGDARHTTPTARNGEGRNASRPRTHARTAPPL